jgi:hypothetical protein
MANVPSDIRTEYLQNANLKRTPHGMWMLSKVEVYSCLFLVSPSLNLGTR